MAILLIDAEPGRIRVSASVDVFLDHPSSQDLLSGSLMGEGGCSSAGRAPALQAGGHRFDPGQLHQVLSFSIYIVK